MATFSFADISATMPQFYRELVRSVQRKAPLLRLLNIKQGMGQNCGWDVSFSGQVANTVNTDGGSFLVAAADEQTAATLSWATYSAPVKVTDKALWTGASHPADYSWFQKIFDRAVMDAIEALVKKINQDLFAGAGTSNALSGLSVAVATSGSYANIAASSYSDWAASVGAGNSGTTTALTLAQLRSDSSTIASDASNGHGRPDMVIMTPAVFDKAESLFDTFARTVFDAKAGTFSQGQGQKVSMNPNVITTPGGQIQRSGFRAMFWENQGLWFIEDPDVTHTAQTNPTATIYYLNSSAVELEYLPPPSMTPYFADQRVVQAAEQDVGPLANLQFEIRPRGRTAHADEMDVLCMLALKVKSRAACGYRTDVS